MDTRPAHHLSPSQLSAINAMRSYVAAMETTLKGVLQSHSDTAPAPRAVSNLYADLSRLRDSATLTIANHARY